MGAILERWVGATFPVMARGIAVAALIRPSESDPFAGEAALWVSTFRKTLALRVGLAPHVNAATPATNGVAMLVPLSELKRPLIYVL